jgi:uncharacterized protein DUF4062
MPINIFVSSTFTDLKNERLQIIEVFRRLRTIQGLNIEGIFMEDFGFSASPPIEKCMELVEKSDAYLGLLGYKYGSVPTGGKQSYTEREYRKAHALHLPIFVLLRTGMVDSSELETDGNKLEKLTSLKEHARLNHTVLPFSSVEELGKVLTQYLPKELKEYFPENRLYNSTDLDKAVPYFQLQNRSESFTSERPNPKSLDVLGMSAINFLRDRSTIEKYLQQGCHIRVLTMPQQGLSIVLLAKNGGVIDIKSDIENAVSRARRYREFSERILKKSAFEMKQLDWTPSCTLFLFDRGLASAIGWIGYYTPDITTPAGYRWCVEVTPNRGSTALEFYFQQFDSIWEKAQSIGLDNSK